MRTLGINGAGDVLYLALAVDGAIVDVEPYTVTEPGGLATDERLVAVREQVKRILVSHSVDRVCVLDAEAQYKATYASMRDRITLEAVALLASAEAEVEAFRVSRAKTRSLLNLSADGPLSTRVPEVTKPVGGSWSKKRDLAALVALAGEKK